LNNYKGNTLFIKGKVENKQIKSQKGNITFYNFMNSNELEKSINQSEIVLARSGYTTIMDLAKLEKKAFFIPTPGQFEQEYLAKRLENLWMVPSCKQDDFKIEMLNKAHLYYGLHDHKFDINYRNLFGLFQSERKFTANT